MFNFSSGPAILPESVLQAASKAVLEIDGSGMSILEVSHRGPEYEKVHFEAQALLLQLMGLKESEYTVLFLGGGASLQFAMAPMNFLSSGQTADFIHTGEWSGRAIQEAKRFGNASIAGSSEKEKFSKLPRTISLTPGARYVHVTTNNTIEGTQWQSLPDLGSSPLIADSSSDLLWNERDHSRYSLIYAGAQKNLGPAGVTVVVIKNSFMATASKEVPTLLSYSAHAQAKSLYNTPPVFNVYVLGEVLKWLKSEGGPAAMGKRNMAKAQVIYQALDAHVDFYEPTVTEKSDRSMMNLTFRLRKPELEKAFLAKAESRKLMGLKGHRSVGGFRASIYNAFPREGCERLAQFLDEFAKSS